jgi:transposase, IS5 family
MRKRFEQQLKLGVIPISEVSISTKSRDELPPVLVALQHIFVTPELSEAVFALLEQKICSDKKKTGRPGMDLWQILVFAVVRHTLNTNWDRLEYLSNHDMLLRKILGVHYDAFSQDATEFSYQTIVDNVSLIDETMLYQINEIVVTYGQKLFKKKDDFEVVLSLKTDSFAVETNIHFPTDLNLLYDSLRKGIQLIGNTIKADKHIKGWRKHKSIVNDVKSLFRASSQQVFKGKNEALKKEFVTNYLKKASGLSGRLKSTKEVITNLFYKTMLDNYIAYIDKFIDQLDRRILKGEEIPSKEKVYSIFESHTEWITKGKLNKKVELGHLVLITSDQYGFIVDYKAMVGQKDAEQIPELCVRLKSKLLDKGVKINSMSFDKGFSSKENQEVLDAFEVEEVVLPKRGKHTKEDAKREGAETFKVIRRKHSAVESNINMLEQHGLNRCMDKGLRGFKCYVGMSVLAYNIHRLGNKIVANQKLEEQKILKKANRVLKAA